MGGLDVHVNAAPEEAFVPVGVFGSRGRAAYLAETHAVLARRVVERFRSFVGANANA